MNDHDMGLVVRFQLPCVPCHECCSIGWIAVEARSAQGSSAAAAAPFGYAPVSAAVT